MAGVQCESRLERTYQALLPEHLPGVIPALRETVGVEQQTAAGLQLVGLRSVLRSFFPAQRPDRRVPVGAWQRHRGLIRIHLYGG